MCDDDVRMFRCDCDNGWIEGEPYSYDPRNGDPICHQYRCDLCDEYHEVPVKFVPINEDEFEEAFGP